MPSWRGFNSDVTPFAMRIIDGSITSAEQHEFADRLVALGRSFHERANGIADAIEEDILTRGTNGNGQIECRSQWERHFGMTLQSFFSRHVHAVAKSAAHRRGGR